MSSNIIFQNFLAQLRYCSLKLELVFHSLHWFLDIRTRHFNELVLVDFNELGLVDFKISNLIDNKKK